MKQDVRWARNGGGVCDSEVGQVDFSCTVGLEIHIGSLDFKGIYA